MGDFASGGGMSEPLQMVFGPDGNLYVSGYDSRTVVRYDGRTGAFRDVFIPSGSGGLSQPAGLVFAPSNNLYVADYPNARVLRFDATSGANRGVLVSASSGGLMNPGPMTLGPDGNLYVGDWYGNKVLRYNGTNGAFISVFIPSPNPGVNGPANLAFGPDGNFYVSCYNEDCVKRFNGVTGAFMDRFASGNGLSAPWGMIFVSEPTLEYQYGAGSGTMQLSWTGSMYRLQAHTNTLGGGVTAPWFDYRGATNGQATVPVDPGKQSVFYRLVWP
jgi:streptogramin lyase